MSTNIIIYDKQGITRLGLEALIKLSLPQNSYTISFVEMKRDLVLELVEKSDSLVIMDYTLSDFSSIDSLLNMSARFQYVKWILFSEELSFEFLKKIILSNNAFSIVLKNTDISEIQMAILSTYNNKEAFICSQVKNYLLMTETACSNNLSITLTVTEKEILKEIAWGKTAKEIAFIRGISVYTVVTHRKNIYRKLDVNNSQEASRYALRAGIIDASDYYI